MNDYASVTFPREIVDAIEKLIEGLKYWPSVTSFVREAALDKIREERKILEEVNRRC